MRMLPKFIKLEKVTKPINGSFTLKTSVIKKSMCLRNINEKIVRKILKIILPNATLFLAALPPKAVNNILIVVPVSEPSTIAVACGKSITFVCKAVRVSAIVTELD